MRIRIFRDAAALNREAAELFTARAEAAISMAGRFSVVLSGGSTPLGVYRLLAGSPFRDRVPWGGVEVFWGDERCVPEEDPRSNAGNAGRVWLGKVPLAAERIHPIACAGSPVEAALDYERLLESHFENIAPRFDLVFLGLGEDGHTASLFPGDPLREDGGRLVREVRRQGGEPRRVTLLPGALSRAALVVFLVSGALKAEALKSVIEEGGDPERFPARLIRPDLHGGELLWMVDEAAASLLVPEDAGRK